MPTDAFIHLDKLRCLAEEDGSGHSDPYAWTILLWIDDTTIASPNIVGARAPGNLQASRELIDRNMRPGDTAPMPAVQRSFAHHFADGLGIRQIGVIVTLLEADETPDAAVRAAYDAYVSELPRAIGEFIRVHRRGPQTEKERQQIAAEVRPKVIAASKDALTGWQKFRIAIGTLNLDDQIDFEFFFTAVPDSQPSPEPFTLEFRTANGRNHYALDGRFELLPPPAADPGQG